MSFWVSRTATACPAWNTMAAAARTVAAASRASSARRHITPIASSTGSTARPIGICHGFPLAEVAAHADEHQERKLPAAHQGEEIDAVSDTARLHEQHSSPCAEVRAREQADPFFLGGEGDGVDVRVRKRPVDEHLVAGVGDVGDLRHVELAKHLVDLVRPGCAGLRLAALHTGDFPFSLSHCNSTVPAFTVPARWTRPSGAGKNSRIPRMMPFRWSGCRVVAVDDVGPMTKGWFGRVESRPCHGFLSTPAVHSFPANSG